MHQDHFRAELQDQGRLGPHPCPRPERLAKQPQRHHDPRPNVLWLMADQMRADMLGYLGHPAVRTPNLDRLAAAGVCCTRAYCSSPVCMPARASMLTGQYLPQHQVWNNGHPMADNCVTFLDQLRTAGYRTANIGKIHCGRSGDRIFEWRANSPDIYGCTMPAERPFDSSMFAECVFIADEDNGNPNDVLYGRYPAPEACSKSYRLATQADGFLQWHDEARPFFLRVSFDDPHPPVMPPEPYASMYGPEHVPEDLLRAMADGMDDKCQTVQDKWRHRGQDRISPEQHRLHAARYMALCTHLDAQIGRVLDSLEAYGYSDNTLVFFNADHGHLIGEHGATHKHTYLYEGVNRIPTILRWPGRLPAGRRCHALIAGEDVAATFLDALEQPIPEHMMGVSMLPVLRGERECLHEELVIQWDDYGFALTGERWKLITYDADATGELYDLQNDPWEVHNRWHDPALADLRRSMLERIDAWRRAHGATRSMA